jgi:hypothetical protein
MMLRGLFLTSEQPADTARFYREVAGLPMEQVGESGGYVYWRLDDGRMQLAIHDAKAFSDYTFPVVCGSNATQLYFHIEDQQAFRARLEQLGIEPYSLDDVVVTVTDPDGRKVLFGTA